MSLYFEGKYVFCENVPFAGQHTNISEIQTASLLFLHIKDELSLAEQFSIHPNCPLTKPFEH